MKLLLPLILFAMSASAHANLADGRYACSFHHMSFSIVVEPTGIKSEIFSLPFSSEWKKIRNSSGDVMGVYRADRYENAILIATDLRNAGNRIVSSIILSQTPAGTFYKQSVTKVGKNGEDADIQVDEAQCTMSN